MIFYVKEHKEVIKDDLILHEYIIKNDLFSAILGFHEQVNSFVVASEKIDSNIEGLTPFKVKKLVVMICMLLVQKPDAKQVVVDIKDWINVKV